MTSSWKNLRILPVLLLVGLLGPVSTSQNPYCSITPQHTLCKFPGVGPKCKTPLEIGVPRADRDLIMDMHNSMRSRVATGIETRGRPGPQPMAANMKELVWDDELAATAQRLADQCKYAHDCLDCRKVSRFLTGQNLYQFSENIRRPNANWASAIDAWYIEVADWSPSHIKSFHFIKPLGHYTQMLWAETTAIGCGYSYFNDGKWNRKLYICNYGPAGNIITTPMYQQGQPCSACPQGTTCSSKYPGLCSESQSSSILFPSQPQFGRFQNPVQQQQPRPTTLPPPPTTTTTTTTTTRRPSTKQPVTINEIESNDLQFETRSHFPRKQYKNSNQGRFQYETINNGPSGFPSSFNFNQDPTPRIHFVPTIPPQHQKQIFSFQSSQQEQPIRFSPRVYPRRDELEGRPTATASVSRNAEPPVRRVADMNSILIYCDFDFAKCPIRFTGESWNYTETGLGGFGRGFGASVPPGQMSNLFIRSLMAPQDNGQVCLSFRYLKQGKGNGGIPLRVTAGTQSQKPRVVEVREESTSPTDWLTANIQFENLTSSFLVIFQIPRNYLQETVSVGIDDVLVTRGICR